ncbi:MAG: hypothetical protein KC910_37030, partial [Candidatus Eremiobacteraeota bacterium]|nr:hypothetical protein [Candidatus Eremiobacteraeota bacterium]
VRLRRTRIETEMHVRIVINPYASFEIRAGSSSGDPAVDEFILEELRRVGEAQVRTDDDGNPIRGMVRKTVRIKVD